MLQDVLEELSIIVRMYSDSLRWYFGFKWSTVPRPRLVDYYGK